jgi:hypothetical protein
VIAEKDPFVQLALGRILHVTSVEGYCGIRRDGFIRPNLGDLKPTHLGLAYYCQKRGAISLLDLRNVDPAELFDTTDWNPQNWHHVFTYHSPSVVLRLDLAEYTQQIFRGSSEELADGARFIQEAEACICGSIPESCIERILIVYGCTDRFVDTGRRTLSEEELTHLRYAEEMVNSERAKSPFGRPS